MYFQAMKFSFICNPCFSSSSAIGDEETIRGTQILKSVHAFSYNDLKLATNGFHISNKIGEGGFGPVYKGRLGDGTIVAVKMLSAESKQGDKEFMSEIVSMCNISHENLVKLHGGCVDGPYRILVYDYMQNNSLARIMSGGEKVRSIFSWERRRKICLGIARGLAYIHEEVRPHIIHRDIKASNIVLDDNFNPKISDFGLSKLFPDDITHISTRVAGTLGYIAPEYAISGRLSRKSDVYSFGVLLLEIVSGRSAIDFDLELGEHFLVEKAWDMYKDEKLQDLVDSSIFYESFSEEEAVRFLKVGLLCVQEKTSLRPNLSMAIRMMIEININNVQVSKPCLINNIMNVKIGQRSHSKSTTPMQSPQLYRF